MSKILIIENKNLFYFQAVPEETMEGAIAGSGAVNVADLGAGACSGAGAAPTFHIPESNASDFAPSECSSHYRKGKQIVVNTNMS